MDANDTALLRRLLDERPVAALGTLHDGHPFVSMVPFVLPADDTRLLIHVSALAPHTRDMQRHPRVSVRVPGGRTDCAAPQALPRVTLQADAEPLPRDADDYPPARAAYLRRFPESAPIFDLGDFSIVALRPVSARLVAGFGRAGSLVGRMLEDWLRGS